MFLAKIFALRSMGIQLVPSPRYSYIDEHRKFIVATQAALCTVYTGDGLPLTRMPEILLPSVLWYRHYLQNYPGLFKLLAPGQFDPKER